MASLLHKWLLVGYMAVVHPFYVSVTEINHNAKDKTIEISCKTFTEDLENAIEKTTKVKVDISNPKDAAAAEKAVSDYIKKHFSIKVDGKPVQLEFVGYERENEATWSYLQVSNVTQAPKRIDITTNLLFEASDQQINLIHTNVGGNKKSTKLNYPADAASFEF